MKGRGNYIMKKNSYPMNLERNTHKYFLKTIKAIIMNDKKYAKKYKANPQYYNFALKKVLIDDKDDFLNGINFYKIIGTNKIILAKSFISLLNSNGIVYKVDNTEMTKPYISFKVDRLASRKNYIAKMTNPYGNQDGTAKVYKSI